MECRNWQCPCGDAESDGTMWSITTVAWPIRIPYVHLAFFRDKLKTAKQWHVNVDSGV
jgi:hypothetical protein